MYFQSVLINMQTKDSWGPTMRGELSFSDALSNVLTTTQNNILIILDAVRMDPVDKIAVMTTTRDISRVQLLPNLLFHVKSFHKSIKQTKSCHPKDYNYGL